MLIKLLLYNESFHFCELRIIIMFREINFSATITSVYRTLFLSLKIKYYIIDNFLSYQQYLKMQVHLFILFLIFLFFFYFLSLYFLWFCLFFSLIFSMCIYFIYFLLLYNMCSSSDDLKPLYIHLKIYRNNNIGCYNNYLITIFLILFV